MISIMRKVRVKRNLLADQQGKRSLGAFSFINLDQAILYHELDLVSVLQQCDI